MKNVFKNILVLFLFIVFVFQGKNVEALEDNNNYIDEYYDFSNSINTFDLDNYKHYDYIINKYDIHMIVNENNTFDITETITAYFNQSRHGIYRTLPLNNTITRLDGSSSKNRAQVSNVSVNHQYTTYKDNGDFIIKIGSPNSYVTGEQTYIIQYTYNIGKDSLKDMDELYYDIIGNDWETKISNITFTIEMPDEFDSSKLGFSAGETGNTNSRNITYTVEGNIIFGAYQGILSEYEGLTVRLELKEGYFKGAGLKISYLSILAPIFAIIFLIIAIRIWHKYGKDDQVIETVEFYPPNNLNSLDIGFLYKGYADSKDITSLLIYLANKGYLKISEIEKKRLFFKKKTFTITKLKDYYGDDLNEQMFLDGLKKKDGPSNSNDITKEDLFDNFYLTINKISSNINSKEKDKEVYEEKTNTKVWYIVLMILITFILIELPPLLDNYGLKESLIVFALSSVGFSVWFYSLIPKTRETKGRFKNFLLTLFFGFMIIIIPWIAILLPILLLDKVYLIGYIIGIICIFGMILLIKLLPKRTSYGNEMLGKIRGFKHFLETAEKEKLEALVMENPTYFYDILPYTYVLGVSNKWIKKFESISMKAPDWYDTHTAFSYARFNSFMSTTVESAQVSMTSTRSSSSDGGFSGGGFSGGGSGGGGGGSW